MLLLLLPDSGGDPGLSLSNRLSRSPSSGSDFGFRRLASAELMELYGIEDDRREEVWEVRGEAVGEVEMLMPEEGRPLLWGLLLVLLLVLTMDRPDLSVQPSRK